MYILAVIYNLSNSKTDIEVIVVFYVIDTALIPFLENLQECRRKLVLLYALVSVSYQLNL